nr:uncharacterized protein LOC105346118 [Crassostrea gigas]
MTRFPHTTSHVTMYGLQISAAIVGLLVCIGKASGIACYNCSSEHDPLCGDPFWGGSQYLINCPSSCLKVKRSSTYGQKFHRSCFKAEIAGPMLGGAMDKHCVTQYVPFQGEVTQCYCTAKGCNSGPSSHCNLITLTVVCLIGALTFESYIL